MALEQSNISGVFYYYYFWGFFLLLFFFSFIRLSTVQENEYTWFARRADDDFCIFCHLPAHISRSEMLTFLLNFISFLGQAPCLFVSPNEHHFTFDGYWTDHGL